MHKRNTAKHTVQQIDQTTVAAGLQPIVQSLEAITHPYSMAANQGAAAMQTDENKASSSGLEFKLHPLVLINVSDHSTRTRANSGDPTAQVFGILLGSQVGRTVDISNSFEIKYERDAQGIVQVDMPFLVHKQEQYKQTFSRLDVVGWYATGSDLQPDLMAISNTVSSINESPVLMLLDPTIDHARKDLPVALYETELHVVDDVATTIFVRAAYSVETSDAERIGVDQVAKITASGKASGSEQLTSHYSGLHSAIKMLSQRVRLVANLMAKMQSGEIPAEPALLRRCSSLVSALPALEHPQFQADYLTEYNDALLSVLLATMTKGVANANDVADMCLTAYDKPSRRRQM